MKSTLTIRLPDDQRQQLHEMAAKLGKTDSELVRLMIERGLAEEPIGRRIGHLKGILQKLPPASDSLARSIRERNWRP
jgi:hypothetical protein